jgi:hypothetical protein
MISELPFERLLTKVRTIDRQAVDAILRYHAAISMQMPMPSYTIESYPFGQPMFVEGRSSSTRILQAFPSSDREAPSFPLGLILSGYVEITDYAFGAGAPRLAPYAVLKPGNFIGLFEFMDWIANGKASGVPDWTITAGSASICCAFGTSNDAFAKHIRRQFASGEVNEHAIRSSDSFLGQLTDIASLRSKFKEYSTEILYFGHNWFQPFLKESVDDTTRSAGRELIRVLGDQAWRAASRIRPSASSIAPFFFGGRTNGQVKLSRPELHDRQRAIHIFTALYDVYSGRRPMFIPERQDGPWGPIGQICTNVLRGYKGEQTPFVLRPEYVTDIPNAVAYMPVENIASDLIESGSAHERALAVALNVIDSAARLDGMAGGRSILGEFGNMVEALSVRLPARKDGGRLGNSSVVVRDVVRNAPKGVKFVPMEEGRFFAPYDVTLEKPGGEFFKTCIRFAIPSDR